MQDHLPFIDLSTQHAAFRTGLDTAYQRVMARSHFVLGPEVAAFEADFARFRATNDGIGVGNGLDALTLALRALDIGPGDEVIVAAYAPASEGDVDRISREVLSLPFWPEMTTDMIDRVPSAVRQFFGA